MRINNLPAWTYKRSMPNINSADYDLDLTRKIESSCCGPIAVANIMLYLAKHSCCRLVPPIYDLNEDHFISKLIETLAKFMDTTSIGTYPNDLIDGIERYVINRGYNISIKSTGWVYGKKYKEENHPSPDWVMRGILGSSNSILNFANYEYNDKKDLYKRKKGHLVTATGFVRDWDELLVHDCASFTKPPAHYQLFKFQNIKLNAFSYSMPTSKYYWLRECNSLGEPYSKLYEPDLKVLDEALSFEVTPK